MKYQGELQEFLDRVDKLLAIRTKIVREPSRSFGYPNFIVEGSEFTMTFCPPGWRRAQVIIKTASYSTWLDVSSKKYDQVKKLYEEQQEQRTKDVLKELDKIIER